MERGEAGPDARDARQIRGKVSQAVPRFLCLRPSSSERCGDARDLWVYRWRSFDNSEHPTMHSGYLREGAEKARAFVLLMGNLGNHHTGLDARAFRGFAFADPIAPFVVINKNDSRAAWSVMLLHELAHLWLGQTSVSGYDGEGEAERFCDAVAARFMLDPHQLSHLEVLAGVPKIGRNG
jgi:hypothetical protein